MNYIDITTENVKWFLPEVDPWIVDNISRDRFYAVGAEVSESPAGAILYTIRQADEDEGKIGVLYHLSGDEGVMKALLDEYAFRCEGLDINYTIIETSDEKLRDFLADYGFDMDESESIVLTFKVEDLESIESFKTVEIPPSIRPLSQVSPIEFRYFLQEYRESVNLNPFFEIESTPMSWYDNDVSCVSLTDEGIDAAFLVHFDGNNTVTTELLAGVGDNFTKKIPYLLVAAAQNALYTYMPDTRIVVRRDGKQIKKITERILPGMKGEKAYHGVFLR